MYTTVVTFPASLLTINVFNLFLKKNPRPFYNSISLLFGQNLLIVRHFFKNVLASLFSLARHSTPIASMCECVRELDHWLHYIRPQNWWSASYLYRVKIFHTYKQMKTFIICPKDVWFSLISRTMQLISDRIRRFHQYAWAFWNRYPHWLHAEKNLHASTKVSTPSTQVQKATSTDKFWRFLSGSDKCTSKFKGNLQCKTNGGRNWGVTNAGLIPINLWSPHGEKID